MKWCLCDNPQPRLDLVGSSQAERNQVLQAIETLEAGGDDEKSFAEAIETAILDGVAIPAFLERLGKWCDVQGSRTPGREPARQAAITMFGRIVPRRDESEKLNDWFRSFCESVGISSCDQPAIRQYKGSQLCIQTYVNDAAADLTNLIILHSASLQAFGATTIEWRSPLRSQGYYEYRDDFLAALDLSQFQDRLAEYWPSKGPQWDALGKVRGLSADGVILAEAKGHPGEANSTCGAKDPRSLEKIRRAFASVQGHMGTRATTTDDWMSPYYQAANRIAFLHFLNEVIEVPAWLVLINFVNDQSHRPTTLADWRNHQSKLFQHLGLAPARAGPCAGRLAQRDGRNAGDRRSSLAVVVRPGLRGQRQSLATGPGSVLLQLRAMSREAWR